MEEKKLVTGDEHMGQEEAEMITSGEGYVITSVEEMNKLAEQAQERFGEFGEQVAGMTKDQSKKVRTWRVDDGYSWRSIAQQVHELGWFGEFYPSSNQLAGIALCDKAANMLGEEYMKEPWN